MDLTAICKILGRCKHKCCHEPERSVERVALDQLIRRPGRAPRRWSGHVHHLVLSATARSRRARDGDAPATPSRFARDAPPPPAAHLPPSLPAQTVLSGSLIRQATEYRE